MVLEGNDKSVDLKQFLCTLLSLSSWSSTNRTWKADLTMFCVSAKLQEFAYLKIR